MYDNRILVEFEALIDLDLAIYKYIRNNYASSEYVDQEFIHLMDEREIIYRFLSRKHINPLEIIMPDLDTENLYNDLRNNHLEDLLQYATAYDTFGLMITYLNLASSVSVTVWCKSKTESDFIKSLNSRLETIVVPERKDIDISEYTIIYTKYVAQLLEYPHIEGKHLFIAAAKFNMEENSNMPNKLCVLFTDVNLIHLVDLYAKIKYRYDRKDDIFNEDSI